MKRFTAAALLLGIVIGISLGLILQPLSPGADHHEISIWLEIVHRVCTSIGGLGTFVTLIIVSQQFYMLRAQSALVQKNIVASMDAQLYGRLDSFNRFVFEHSVEYDLLDKTFPEVNSQEQRSKLHRMCELGFTFFEEIFKYHIRLKLLETEDWDEWEQGLVHFFQKPYVRGYWKSVATRYTKSFQKLVTEVIGKIESE